MNLSSRYTQHMLSRSIDSHGRTTNLAKVLRSSCWVDSGHVNLVCSLRFELRAKEQVRLARKDRHNTTSVLHLVRPSDADAPPARMSNSDIPSLPRPLTPRPSTPATQLPYDLA